MSNKRKSLLLLIVPVVFICVALAFAMQMYPIYANTPFYGQDPAYQYLFAGVDILLGNAPAHNDHPGTPLQSLIALTISVVWYVRHLIGGLEQDMFVSVLATPELYLKSVSVVVVFLNTLAIFYLGKRIYQVTQNYIAAVVCQMAPLVFVLVSPNILYPAPESLLWCVSLCLLGVLAPALLGASSKISVVNWKMAVLSGVFCGLGLAVKVTFLPLLGLLLILRKWRLMLLSGVVMAAAWLIGVLPIYSRLGKMFDWFYQVMNHTGLHGEGQNTVFNVSQFVANFAYVRTMFPILDTAVWLMVVVSVWGVIQRAILFKRSSNESEVNRPLRSNTDAGAWLTPFVLTLVVIAQAIMVAKHPGPTYMIPVLPIAMIVVVWFLHAQKFIIFSTNVHRVLWGIVFVFFTYLAAISSVGAYNMIAANQSRGAQSNRSIYEAIKKFQQPVLIGTFNCTLPSCALWFGQLMTPDVERKMDQVTTDFYHFDIFAKNLHVPGKGALNQDESAQTIKQFVESGRPVLLISPPYEQLAGFEVEKIVSTQVQDLYRVSGYKMK